ncbi:HAD-IIIA family hydrolase [Tissierella carlieri]|uniref:HAD family hydrolase n=1 Tax=Tissierella carlieri TaxID=689904 RepID=A0ABT1SAW0_9FIRM|nr:HAD-IIIA family hydrolase [Tissierella carlieri]MCQ4923608.1 HAD family hydrolase [Tissierella carlieri]MDU5082875.1 HAD family hydrolase [Bacillota bacterium]
MTKSSKVIFFDMGNTLLHFHFGKTDEEKDIIGIKHLTNFLKQYNRQVEFNDVKKHFFDEWQKVMPLRKINHTEYAVEDYLNGFLKKYDIELDLDMCIKALDIFYTEYRNDVWTEENIHHTLENIKQKGYRIGVISNSRLYDEVMINCFKKVGLAKYIDVFTFSYYLKISKPQKQVFEIALDRMKVNPEDAIMVGDNLKSDIEPAQKLGLTGIWFNKNLTLNDTDIKPDNEIFKLKELIDLL